MNPKNIKTCPKMDSLAAIKLTSHKEYSKYESLKELSLKVYLKTKKPGRKPIQLLQIDLTQTELSCYIFITIRRANAL